MTLFPNLSCLQVACGIRVLLIPNMSRVCSCSWMYFSRGQATISFCHTRLKPETKYQDLDAHQTKIIIYIRFTYAMIIIKLAYLAIIYLPNKYIVNCISICPMRLYYGRTIFVTYRRRPQPTSKYGAVNIRISMAPTRVQQHVGPYGQRSWLVKW